MAEKRYFWLKLKEDYFNSPKIKKLRKIAGGDTYTIIYLKMQLLSIRNEGIIQFEGIEKTFEEELALKLDEEIDDVKLTLSYLMAQNLMELNENNEYLLIEANNNIGSEGQSAERKRLFDAKKRERALLCNGDVTQRKRCSISSSISNSNNNSLERKVETKEIKNKENKEEKHRYGEYKHILLTDKELEKLKADYGEEETKEAIKYLDEYIEMRGTVYKSHYLVIKRWVFTAIKEQAIREERVNAKTPKKLVKERKYTTEELNSLYTNIDEIKFD